MVDRKDLATGAIFIAFGALYGIITLQTLPLGRALNMGPGYFPIILSGFMILIGTIIIVRSIARPRDTHLGGAAWRAVIMLSLATILFATLLRELGMFPGTFFTALVASFASSQIRPLRALVTALAIALFCTLVFGYGIKLPVPIVGTWFGG